VPVQFLDPDSPDAAALRAFIDFARSQAGGDRFAPQLIEHFKGSPYEPLFSMLLSRVMELKLLPEEALAEMLEKTPQIEKQHVNREIDRRKA
jgi:hypothetical protein